jgi:hypothetical protein
LQFGKVFCFKDLTLVGSFFVWKGIIMNAKAVARPAASAKQLIRAVHFIDIENLVGQGLITLDEVRNARQRYFQKIGVSSKDIFIVASGPQNRAAVVLGWPGSIYKFKKGADGADLALISVFHEFDVLSVASELFIGSGDNRFAEIAHLGRAAGKLVTVVTGVGARSYRLQPFNSVNLLDVAA